MKKFKLYLETSVWNFYFANDAPEKKEATIKFFARIEKGDYEIFISEVVTREINRASENKRNLLMSKIEAFKTKKLAVTDEVESLARIYIAAGILTEKSIEDARHAALATVYQLDALISWNMKHLANYSRVQKINGINFQNGYIKRIDLITPMEVAEDES